MIRIHYIEDNLVDQHALIREIDKKELPYTVEFSSSIAEARRKKDRFDVILCDYYLPDGTILNLLPDLVQDHTPIVVLTGLADLNNAVSALKLGAKDYLVKDPSRQYLSLLPIQIENLLRSQAVEEERRWLSALFLSIAETIPFGLYLYEPESDRIVYHNDAFDTIWQISKYQGTDALKTHTDVCRLVNDCITDQSVKVNIFPSDNLVDSPFESEGEIRVCGDRTIKFFTLLVPCRHQNASCYVSICNDISELSKVRESLYQYSQELERANATLDQRVRERTRQIIDLMQKKDEMIVSIGHDLRTPLTPLVALLPLLHDHETDPLKKNQLAILCDGARKIRALADAAYRVGYMGTGSPGIGGDKVTACNLRKIADAILFSHLPVIDDKMLSVSNTIPESITIQITPVHLHQILDNLIRNAIQYTNPGGTITLHGGLDPGRVWFCISDTGIGLTSDDSSRIFDEFYKVDAARNNLETHGLGLAEVKKLVLLNHGHITVKSHGPGTGSRFCINLPTEPTLCDGNVPVDCP